MTETVGSTATPESGSGSGDDASRRDRKRARKAGDPEGKGGRGKRAKGPNIFARTALFYRQIITELRKVVWPSRSDLTSYTSVVIVFVLVIMALVYGLDTGFVKLAGLVFG